MKTYTCKHCGELFENRYDLTGHVTKWHSTRRLEVAEATRKAYREEYDRHPKFCTNCGKKLPYEKRAGKFCNQSCAASFNNKKRGDKQDKTYVCRYCGKVSKKKYPSENKQFCSSKCAGLYRQQKFIDSWLKTGQLSISASGQIASRRVKAYIQKEQNNKCAICGREAVWEGKPLVLILDHIDGDSTHNSRDNLRLVCPNCDTQLDTYKSKNKGRGRRSRGFSANKGL